MNKKLNYILPVYGFFLLSLTTPYFFPGETQDIFMLRIVLRSLFLGMGFSWLIFYLILKRKNII